MSNTIKPTQPAGVSGARKPIRAMYGVFMDRMTAMISEVNRNIAMAEAAIKGGGLPANEAHDIKRALTCLKAAKKDLKVPGGKLPVEKKDSGKTDAVKSSPGGIVAMYGVRMKRKIDLLRNQVLSSQRFIETVIASKALKGQDLIDAKQARIDLKNALHALTPPRS